MCARARVCTRALYAFLHSLFIPFNFSTANKDNDHSFEPTHTSFGLAGTSLSLESQEAQSQSINLFFLLL